MVCVVVVVGSRFSVHPDETASSLITFHRAGNNVSNDRSESSLSFARSSAGLCG